MPNEEIYTLRDDLADIFLQTVNEVKVDTTYTHRHGWDGSFRTDEIETFKVYGRINLGLLSPDQEKTLETFIQWIRSGQKCNVRGFRGVIPLEFDTSYSYIDGSRYLYCKYRVDSIEDLEWVDDILREPEPKKPKKQEHFDKDLFDI